MLDILNTYQALNLSDTIDYDKFNQYANSTNIKGSSLTETETWKLVFCLVHRNPFGKIFLP
jgi:hypothetical protein